ncbi:MAG: transcription termination/antitermination NusG family protein [Bryobacteraceae bacterium]
MPENGENGGSLPEWQPALMANKMNDPEIPWFALSVKPRHEKSVQQHLEYKGYRTSLPLQTCWHTRKSGSDWQSRKPLISGYIFVRHDPGNSLHIVATPGVLNLVGFPHSAGAIPYAEIEALERVAASQLPVAQCGYTRIGEPVRLVRGPLQGVEGIVVRDAGPARLVVSVHLLQRSLAVEIENTWAVPTQSFCCHA